MCLVVSLISLAFAYMFYESENIIGLVSSLMIFVFFTVLLVRNIIKTKKEREKN